jgi:hypothetical protein
LIGIPSREGVCRIFHCECRISTAMVAIPDAVPRPVFDTMLFSVIQYAGARSWPIEVNLPGARRERTCLSAGFYARYQPTSRATSGASEWSGSS